MNLIKVKAKVKFMSEDDMEIEEMDLGVIVKSKDWVWRNIGVLTYQIYKVMEYTPGKSIIEMYNGEKILVLESFDDLYKRWEESIKEEEAPEINNEDSEEISEDEDE